MTAAADSQSAKRRQDNAMLLTSVAHTVQHSTEVSMHNDVGRLGRCI